MKRKTNTENYSSDTQVFAWPVLFQVSILAILFVVSACPGLCRADIYKSIDKEGVVLFTNTPTSSDYVLYIREKLPPAKVAPVSRAYKSIIQKAQETYGIEFSLIKAVIQAESGFNHRAVSKKGATGLMQIMPENYKFLSISDPFDPSQNIMGGSQYLKLLLTRYDDKLPLALAAYNAGPEAVDRYGQIPPYAETQNYVQKVMRLYNRYKNLLQSL